MESVAWKVSMRNRRFRAKLFWINLEWTEVRVFDVEPLVIPDDYVKTSLQKAIDQSGIQGIQFIKARVGFADKHKII